MARRPTRPIILSAFFFNPQGDHRMSWRHPEAPGREVFGLDYYADLARSAERACLDAIFVADHVGVWDLVPSARAAYANARLEPLTLLSALAAVTRHIGLLATASSSFTEPYNLARQFASLDHLSGGRAGWNVVTSAMDEEAMNYGRNAVIEHGRRYALAAEALDAVTALWDSWEDEAIRLDREAGVFADETRVHRIDHAGPHLTIRGPLNVPRPPQGHPLILQAGSSEAGRDFAARHADVQFAILKTIEEGVAYRADMDARLARAGRAPPELRLLPGVMPVVAASRVEAEERQAALEALMPDRVAIDLLQSWSGLDLAHLPPDAALPPLPAEGTFDGVRTWLPRIRELAAQNLSIVEIARRLSNSGSVPTVAGTPREVADQLEAWVTAGAADGFNLMFPLLPCDWHAFIEGVVPELQRRGLARDEYGPGTLRDRLGLPRPANRFAPAAGLRAAS